MTPKCDIGLRHDDCGEVVICLRRGEQVYHACQSALELLHLHLLLSEDRIAEQQRRLV